MLFLLSGKDISSTTSFSTISGSIPDNKQPLKIDLCDALPTIILPLGKADISVKIPLVVPLIR